MYLVDDSKKDKAHRLSNHSLLKNEKIQEDSYIIFPVNINLESITEEREGGNKISELQQKKRDEIKMVSWCDFKIKIGQVENNKPGKLHLQLRIKEIN